MDIKFIYIIVNEMNLFNIKFKIISMDWIKYIIYKIFYISNYNFTNSDYIY